jgi:tRNA threonylcarbamoyladenosine biosynthesis protein TsaE
MGEPGLSAAPLRLELADEPALRAAAGHAARRWSGLSEAAAVLGLTGGLGSGKTTWVRGMLTGLGFTGRVPSPTYTLLEHYPLPGLDFVHLDLYRLGHAGGPAGEGAADASAELDAIGVRDWLSATRCWLVVEWPERALALMQRCDLTIAFASGTTEDARAVTFNAVTACGGTFLEALRGVYEPGSSKIS